MSTINVLGPVGFNPTGPYDATRTYQKLDVVYYQGSSYVAISDSLGQLPTNADYWLCIAAGSLKQFIYNSVASMKADNTLADGMTVQTLGYYDINDGGSALYKIRTITNDDVVDEKFIIALNDETLIAELIINDPFYIKQIGNITSDNINYAMDYLYEKYGSAYIKINKEKENIILDKYIYILNNCTLDLNNNNIEFGENFESKNGFCIGLNTKNGNTWDTQYNRDGCIIKNGDLINEDINYKCIISLSTNATIEHVNFIKFKNSISKSTYYTDLFKVDKCNFYPSEELATENFQIRCEYGGDGLLINQCHFGVGSRIYEGWNTKAIYLFSCQGGKITNCINGVYTITDSQNIELTNMHIERGSIIFNNSIASVNGAFIWNPSNENDRIDVNYNSDVSLDNITFYNTIEDYQRPTNEYYDISVIHNAKLTMNNVIKKAMMSTDFSIITPKMRATNDQGIKFSYDNFNLKSSILYKNITISNNSILDYILLKYANSDYNISNYTIGSKNFNGTQNTTYYYNCCLYFDDGRKLGYGTETEISVPVTDKSIMLSINKTYGNVANVRLYRGTSTGVYDKYVDIGIVTGSKLEDFGNDVNGVVWKNRTASAIDSINQCNLAEYKSNITAYMSSNVAYGTWYKNDKLIRTGAVNSSDVAERLCTAYGTPGTWKNLIIIP